MYYFSKSKYCIAAHCPKILWWQNKYPDEIYEDKDAKTASLFDAGNEVGKIARSYFGEYRLVEYNNDLNEMINATQSLLSNGVINICEASFSFDNCFCSVDLLRNLGKDELTGKTAVELYEVKSSSHVKDSYYHDISYQYYVLSKLGYDVKKACLMHI
ncbi:MAG: DUF2779 domain-containing protein, partial [Treponema sp.]|nr:DUF2779 domain-containing protein [Treponema sp.]